MIFVLRWCIIEKRYSIVLGIGKSFSEPLIWLKINDNDDSNSLISAILVVR